MKTILELKVGDVVATDAHDYKMCVKERKADKAVCTWFDKDQQLHEEQFSSEELHKVTNI